MGCWRRGQGPPIVFHKYLSICVNKNILSQFHYYHYLSKKILFFHFTKHKMIIPGILLSVTRRELSAVIAWLTSECTRSGWKW